MGFRISPWSEPKPGGDRMVGSLRTRFGTPMLTTAHVATIRQERDWYVYPNL